MIGKIGKWEKALFQTNTSLFSLFVEGGGEGGGENENESKLL